VIVQNSVEGKADNAKVDALVKKKQAEAAALKTPTPQAQQQFQQQAQQEVQQLQAQLQGDFQQKLMPILTQLAQEKHLSMLLSAQDAGLIWAEPGLDLTAEAIKRFDAAAKK
jgi:Skp family chaperone for outer membrane proteins